MNIEPTTALRIALPVPLRQHFDYLPKEGSDLVKLQPGMRIKVPFQRRELIGIFIEYTQTPEVAWERLKPIIEVLDPTPLITDEIFKLARWAADYYHYPLGEVLVNALPVLLRKGQSKYSAKIKHEVVEPIPFLELNPAQSEAVQAINATDHFQVFLLNGVTGSGKTEVYLHVIQHTLKKEKQVLVLVPEIGLTPQTIQRFRERFQVPIIALHSGLTEKERLNAWHLSRLNEASIIIGTRSAVFSPFKNLGLIIIDEEHDLSFKQQDGFRYHARDIAIMRAHFANIPIVLGSATPSLETLYKAQKGKFKELQLTERTGNAQLPKFEILDIRNQALDNGLSQSLISQIKHEIDQQNQVILFLNRRGFAPIIMCHHCGWMIHCERCDMRMTYHQHSKRLHCHHCDSQKKLPHTCESCQGRELIAIGLGTERLEETLQKYFPEISIARMDRDNTQRKGSLENLLNRIQSGEDRILIGTQMLAKGHHFPNVTLVAVIDADGGFFSSDFRALERMGQLLVQVAGRAGRVEKQGRVIIQTHHPDHPLLHQLFNENFKFFAQSILAERAAATLPPYTFFALFRAEAHQLSQAMDFLKQVKALIPLPDRHLQVLGPIPATMAKKAGRYRVQLLLQTSQRPYLQRFLKHLIPNIEKIPLKSRVRWSLDVDPMEMF